MASSTPCADSETRKLNEDYKDSTRHLPEGVIQNILAKLPVKSIIRFQSTSKNWYSLIKSPYFVEFHREDDRDRHRDRNQNELWFSHSVEGGSCLQISSLSASTNQSTRRFDLGAVHSALWSGRSRRPEISVVGPLNNGIFCVIAQDGNSKLTRFLGVSFCNNTATTEGMGMMSIDRMYFQHSSGSLISCDRSSCKYLHSSLNHLSSWACWKTLGHETYVSLEPVTLQI